MNSPNQLGTADDWLYLIGSAVIYLDGTQDASSFPYPFQRTKYSTFPWNGYKIEI